MAQWASADDDRVLTPGSIGDERSMLASKIGSGAWSPGDGCILVTDGSDVAGWRRQRTARYCWIATSSTLTKKTTYCPHAAPGTL